MVGVTVSWIPLAADYTRFARTPKAAFWGTGIGYFVPDTLLLALGAVVLLTRDLADPSALPAAVAAGGLVALLALVALTVAETDEAFANAYSGAVSLQNLFPWPRRNCSSSQRRRSGSSGRWRSSCRASSRSSSSSARSSFRCSPCSSPTGSPPADASSRRTSSPRRPCAQDDRRLGRRLRRIPVALADRAELVGRAGPAARPALVGDRRDAPELRRRVRPGSARRGWSTGCANVVLRA